MKIEFLGYTGMPVAGCPLLDTPRFSFRFLHDALSTWPCHWSSGVVSGDFAPTWPPWPRKASVFWGDWCLKIGCSSLGVKLQVDLDCFIFPRSRRLRGKNDEIQLELLGLKNQCYQTQNMCTAIFTGRAMGRPSVIQYDARKCALKWVFTRIPEPTSVICWWHCSRSSDWFTIAKSIRPFRSNLKETSRSTTPVPLPCQLAPHTCSWRQWLMIKRCPSMGICEGKASAETVISKLLSSQRTSTQHQ